MYYYQKISLNPLSDFNKNDILIPFYKSLLRCIEIYSKAFAYFLVGFDYVSFSNK